MNAARLALIALLLPAAASAREIGAGTFQLSGGTQISYSSFSTEQPGFDDVDDTSFDLNGSGYFYVIPNLGIGAFISHNSSTFEQGVDSDDSSQTSIGPAITYNFPVAPQLSLFAEALLGYSTASFNDGDASGFLFGLGGGLRFFPADRVSLDASVNWSTASLEDDFNNEADTSGLSLGVGISVYFGGGTAPRAR